MAVAVLACTVASGSLFPVGAQQSAPDADSVVAIDAVTVEIGRLHAGAVPLAETPFSSQVIAGEGLARAGGGGISSALGQLPGVTLTSQTGSPSQVDIRLRGFAVSPIVGVPQSVSVFVDGVRVNEADASQVHLSLIPGAAVERIELVRGPVGVFGKNAIAGALNFVTRRAQGGPKLAAEIQYGSFDSKFTTWTASTTTGSVDALVVGAYGVSEGWRAFERSEELSLFTKLGWRGDRTDGWISYTFEADSLEGAGPLPESWLVGSTLPPEISQPPSDRRRLQYTGGGGDAFTPRLHFLNGQLERELSDAWAVQANAYGRFADFRQTNDNLSEPDALGVTDIGSVGSTLQARYRPGDGLVFTSGVEWSRNDVDIEIHEVPNRSFPSLTQAITEHLQTNEDNLGAFAELWWELAPGVATYGSLRYDHVTLPVRDLLDPTESGTNTFSELTGGVGLSGDLGSGLSVFAGYGRGFRAPVILEVTCADPDDPCQLPFDLGPDPPLDPVKSDSWQAGLRMNHGRSQATLVAYWTTVHDDIFNVVAEDTPTRGYFTNVDRTRRAGLEASLTGRPLSGMPGLALAASLGWTRATFQSYAELASPLVDDDPPAPGTPPSDEGSTQVEPGDRFPMVPELSATVGLEYEHGPVTIGVETSWTGSQFLIGDEGNEQPFPKIDDTTVLDVHVEWRLGASTVFAALANALDQQYAAFGVISENGRATPERVERFLTPGGPRRLTVGLRFSVAGGGS